MIPITRALTAEHKMFNAVFDHAEEVLPGLKRLDEVKRLARLVEGLLRSHAKVEDDLLILARDHASKDKRQYDRCRHEHQELDSRLIRAQSALSIVRARKLVRGAITASRQHFKREEREVFPLLEKRMDREALAKLGTVWLLQRHAPRRWTL